MSLPEKLANLWFDYQNNPPKHKQETADELYLKITLMCLERSRSGCSALRFHWGCKSDDKSEWEEQHKVVEEVVHRLQADGLNADCTQEFPEEYFNAYDERVQPTGHHNIEVDWKDTIVRDKRFNH